MRFAYAPRETGGRKDLTGPRPKAEGKIVLTGDYTPRALPRLSPQEQEIIAYVELGGTLAIASYAVGILSVQAEHMRESNSQFRAALRVAEQEAVEKYGEPKSEVAQYFMKTLGCARLGSGTRADPLLD